MAAPGGFSSAGAMRTPQTLDGPVVARPSMDAAATSKATQKTPAQAPLLRVKPAVAKKGVAKPAPPPVASVSQQKDVPIVQR
jgi:hypothetical protein